MELPFNHTKLLDSDETNPSPPHRSDLNRPRGWFIHVTAAPHAPQRARERTKLTVALNAIRVRACKLIFVGSDSRAVERGRGTYSQGRYTRRNHYK